MNQVQAKLALINKLIDEAESFRQLEHNINKKLMTLHAEVEEIQATCDHKYELVDTVTSSDIKCDVYKCHKCEHTKYDLE